MLEDLPPLPIARDAVGTRVLLPAEKVIGGASNSENVGLYAIFPYRLYGVGKPDLQLARQTFALRKNKRTTCWYQDPIDAALLGFNDQAKDDVTINFTHSDARFQAFWIGGLDWTPDMDNGGVAMEALQFMLLQCDGRRIQVLPAWPKEWDVDFKLHAPYQTTIEGHVKSGRLIKLAVTPRTRGADVIISDDWSGKPSR